MTDPDIPLVSTSCQWAVVNANQTVSCGPFKKEFVSLFGDFDFKCHCRCNSATVSGQDTCDQQASDGDTSCYYK